MWGEYCIGGSTPPDYSIAPPLQESPQDFRRRAASIVLNVGFLFRQFSVHSRERSLVIGRS